MVMTCPQTLLLVLTLVGVHGQDKPAVFEWKRAIGSPNDGLMMVKETAVVFPNFIIMTSADDLLVKENMFGSTSFHDFDNGVLAIAVYNSNNEAKVCLLSTPVKDYKTTYAELKKRNGALVADFDMGMYQILTTPVTTSGSKRIDQECAGLTKYKLDPIGEVLIKDLVDIGGTRCIYQRLEYLAEKGFSF